MTGLEGRIALVTGASQGIGRACALELAKAGATVALAARNQTKLDEAVAEIEAAGGQILGREITLDVDGIRTRPDLFVRLPNGQEAFVEVKTGGSAALTANQSAAFPGIRAGGAVPVGANAAAAGLTPGVPLGPTPVWVVRQPWPLPGSP